MNPLRYLSVCAGIEAASVAWHGLGWQPAAFSEIEPFPRAVLGYHYPHVPLHGDFTTIGANEYGSIDLLVGGTPCQSFSVAGLRAGLADARGNLAFEFLRLALRERPRWIVWENVPGVLSSHSGRAFGAFVAGMVGCGYGLVWRILDAQYFGVPQRRRRLFVVGYLGDWRPPVAVLFERESLCGDTAPRRETGQVAPTVPSRRTAGGGLGTDFDCDGGLVEASVRRPGSIDVATACNAHERFDFETETLVAHSLRGEGFDASEDGTGRGTPLVPCYAIQERAVSENPAPGPDGAGFRGDGTAYTLEARTVPQAITFTAKDSGADALVDCAPAVRAGGFTASHASGGVMPAVAFQPRIARNGRGYSEGAIPALGGADAGATSDMRPCVASASFVRRLTPRECERLQGFPDDYTLVPWRGRAAADCPDGPRYKALGNSMAVPVMRWIGERIDRVERLTGDKLTPTS